MSLNSLDSSRKNVNDLKDIHTSRLGRRFPADIPCVEIPTGGDETAVYPASPSFSQ